MLIENQDNNLRKRKNSVEDKFNEDRKKDTSLKSYCNNNYVESYDIGEKYRVVHLSCVIWLCFGLLLGESWKGLSLSLFFFS